MWKSFFVAIKDWARYPNKYLGRPKIPKYKAKGGRFVLSLDSNKVKLKKWLKQNYFCAQYFINKNKEQSEKSPNDWFNAGYNRGFALAINKVSHIIGIDLEEAKSLKIFGDD